MPSLDAAQTLIQSHGLWILAPFTVLEGPMVTVIAAYLAQQGYLNVVAVYLVCVLGDLIGDSLLYAVGHFGLQLLPPRLSHWLGMTDARKIALTQHFDRKGGRTLLIGKWTQSAGMPTLIASGMARMNFALYLWFNFLGTLPKTLVLVLLGYFLGSASTSIQAYLYHASALSFGILILAGGCYLFLQRRRA